MLKLSYSEKEELSLNRWFNGKEKTPLPGRGANMEITLDLMTNHFIGQGLFPKILGFDHFYNLCFLRF